MNHVLEFFFLKPSPEMSRSSRATVGDAWRVQSFLERISGGECGVVTLVGSAPAHACDLGAAPQHLLQQLKRRHSCDHKLQDLRGATAEREEASTSRSCASSASFALGPTRWARRSRISTARRRAA